MADPLPQLLDWKKCSRCALCETRANVVLGEGNHETTIIFFGDKPGPAEDKKGEPMCGETGVLYNNLLAHVGINREDVFTDNLVSCWPAQPDGDKYITRDPSVEEIQACLPRVQETIYRIDPLAIVTFGATALKTLTGQNKNITAARGDTFFAYIPGVYKVVKSYPVFPTFHPAYALRRDRAESSKEHEWAPATIKKTIVEDLIRVRDFVVRLKCLYEESR